MRLLRIILLLTFACGSLVSNAKEIPALLQSTSAQPSQWPVPTGIKNMMFYVQRDPNANTIIYELNLNKAGVLNEEEPVKVYWIRYADKGERKDLNYIQRKFAYGINAKKLSNDRYELKFVSYSKRPFYLSKAQDGKFHVYATVGQKQIIMNKIYVHIEGGTFWVPNVVYVEISGTDAATGKITTERFKP